MPTESTTVDLTSNQPTANYGAEHGKKMMCADCGSKKVMYAEGETATYSPSEEPDMVSSSDFENPTNENFSAEGEPVAVAEGTSLDGYAPIDSIEESAPIGHGVNQYFGSENALLDESTTNITVEEGVSLEGFNGVDSVVVEAPLGHGEHNGMPKAMNPNLTLMMELQDKMGQVLTLQTPISPHKATMTVMMSQSVCAIVECTNNL